MNSRQRRPNRAHSCTAQQLTQLYSTFCRAIPTRTAKSRRRMPAKQSSRKSYNAESSVRVQPSPTTHCRRQETRRQHHEIRRKKPATQTQIKQQNRICWFSVKQQIPIQKEERPRSNQGISRGKSTVNTKQDPNPTIKSNQRQIRAAVDQMGSKSVKRKTKDPAQKQESGDETHSQQ